MCSKMSQKYSLPLVWLVIKKTVQSTHTHTRHKRAAGAAAAVVRAGLDEKNKEATSAEPGIPNTPYNSIWFSLVLALTLSLSLTPQPKPSSITLLYFIRSVLSSCWTTSPNDVKNGLI